MYAQFFGLEQEPFSIAPDPRYLYMSERHREALAHLLYGVGGGGGFVLLTGEIGAGKTTVCRCFLEQIPERTHVAYIFNPKLTVNELLQSVCEEFRIPVAHLTPGSATVKDYLDPLNEYLLKTHALGQNSVLVIDEAQNLSADVLEQLRLLTNLETSERKLLQIILIGQPELRDMLARPELEQLAQRVTARFHLDALSSEETVQYIGHRLSVAGRRRSVPFDRAALQRIHRLSRGVPRRINLLCDRALLGAYATGRSRIDRRIVDQAATEVFGRRKAAAEPRRGRRAVWTGMGLALAAALFGATALMLPRLLGPDAPAPEPVVAQAPPAADSPQPDRTPIAAAVAAEPAAEAASAASAAASAPATVEPLATDSPFLIPAEAQAWRELAGAWGLALGDGDPCEAARRQQVQCFRQANTSLALIRQLERPGILSLQGTNGAPVWAVLAGLSDDSATLQAGGATQTVTLTSLAARWRGDFATLWRAPAGLRGPVISVESGPVADWLSTQLARVDDATAAPAGTPLKARIVAFQRAHGLPADGLAGPMTFMQLNRAAGVPEPRLQTRP